MYDRRVLVINSVAVRDNSGCSGGSVFGTVAARRLADGLQLKGHRGNILRVRTSNPHARHHCLIKCAQRVNDGPETAFFFVPRELHAERIARYLDEHYGKKRTNCCSFAEYLRTGVFRECEVARENLSLSGGMNGYRGEKVRTGDVLAIFYYKPFARSRQMEHIRRHYLKNKKTAGLDLRCVQSPKRTFTAEALVEEFSSGLYTDYHFMFCIGQRRGEPVFLQQMGRHTPGEVLDGKRAAIVATVGMVSMSDNRVPAGVLIKRGT